MQLQNTKLADIITQKKPSHMRELFASDPSRFSRYTLQTGSLTLDYSKNKIDDEILRLLLDIAKEAEVEKHRDAMFAGQKINTSEHRAVLHTALRDFSNKSIIVDDIDIKPEINKERQRVKQLVESVHKGHWRGFSGKVIHDVVNIGIGGSDLGPKMVTKALSPYHLNKTKVHFVSNVDGDAISNVLAQVNPEHTLFIVASKSFSTQETLMNANTARAWLVDFYKDEKAVANHFVAVSTALKKVKAFGIDLDNCFTMWDWVGGRYSLWSAIGMPIAFAIGFDQYFELLKGAQLMDQHFKSTPLNQNMPVILALLGVLYSNFYHTQSQAILAYDDRLCYLVDYLQQADMESNGKTVLKNGVSSNQQTGVVLWGGVGTNGQHAFHQLLHQGTVMVPADFIIAKQPHHHLVEHHQALLANCFAQSQALMQGKTREKAEAELQQKGYSQDEIKALAPQKVIPGDKPSNTILLDRLTPQALGQLIALYEHKIFVQGIIWDINSFDQWGVELGKELGEPILQSIQGKGNHSESYDCSTLGLIDMVK
ncbi:glucose-6-phosphate isomerase [Facilibium subflavum]|uniref:glucose-6-phosphate isomerase n=1 Tax=Facilibium subflavum TaxID=2219058 RepID=UPI000E64D326|nr:glucose-6-phosphate isomerase [Facilibium subflavum]